MCDLAKCMARTIQELRESMSAEELLIWQARNRESPIGDERADFHAAQIAASMGGGKIADHMPRWGDASNPDDPDAPLNALMGG
jgi:hypothetical protein